jgi:hypothetical protein
MSSVAGETSSQVSRTAKRTGLGASYLHQIGVSDVYSYPVYRHRASLWQTLQLRSVLRRFYQLPRQEHNH